MGPNAKGLGDAMKRKRLKKGQTILIDDGGVPRDAAGHRTDRPVSYWQGKRLWREDKWTREFLKQHSGLYLARMPEHFLEPE